MMDSRVLGSPVMLACFLGETEMMCRDYRYDVTHVGVLQRKKINFPLLAVSFGIGLGVWIPIFRFMLSVPIAAAAGTAFVTLAKLLEFVILYIRHHTIERPVRMKRFDNDRSPSFWDASQLLRDFREIEKGERVLYSYNSGAHSEKGSLFSRIIGNVGFRDVVRRVTATMDGDEELRNPVNYSIYNATKKPSSEGGWEVIAGYKDSDSYINNKTDEKFEFSEVRPITSFELMTFHFSSGDEWRESDYDQNLYTRLYVSKTDEKMWVYRTTHYEMDSSSGVNVRHNIHKYLFSKSCRCTIVDDDLITIPYESKVILRNWAAKLLPITIGRA